MNDRYGLHGILVRMAVAMASAVAVAGPPTGASKATEKASVALTLIPATHSLYVRANMVAGDDQPGTATMARDVFATVMGRLRGGVGKRVAKDLGFATDGIAAFHLSADLRPDRRGLGDVIVVVDLKQPTGLEEAVDALRRRGETGFQTEMINGHIVFVHTPGDWSVMQATPTRFVVASRAMIKRVTKLTAQESMAGDRAVADWFAKTGDGNAFVGVVTTVKEAVLPFDFLGFVYRSSQSGSTLKAVARCKSKGVTTTLASTLKEAFGKVFGGLEVTQAGAELRFSFVPTKASIEALMRTAPIRGLFAPVAKNDGAGGEQ